MSYDRPPDKSELPYRLCVGMMLFNADGHVFVGRRIDQDEAAWQMPQGGIGKNEGPWQAALRELEEETGIKNVEFLREYPGWLTYDLPESLIGVALRGQFRGQKQKWFALSFKGLDSEINLATDHQEFSDWKWVTVGELLRLIVVFKRKLYTDVVGAFHDLAGQQRGS